MNVGDRIVELFPLAVESHDRYDHDAPGYYDPQVHNT